MKTLANLSVGITKGDQVAGWSLRASPKTRELAFAESTRRKSRLGASHRACADCHAATSSLLLLVESRSLLVAELESLCWFPDLLLASVPYFIPQHFAKLSAKIKRGVYVRSV